VNWVGSRLGALELTELHSIDDGVWDPLVKEADVLLVNGRDALYLCHWMSESGLAYLFSSLPEMVWAGLSGGSTVMPPHVGEDFGSWKPPEGGDRGAGSVRFCDPSAPRSPRPPGNTTADAERWGRELARAGLRDEIVGLNVGSLSRSIPCRLVACKRRFTNPVRRR
jgi:dipeptidase E